MVVSLKGENYLNIINKGGGNFVFKIVIVDVVYIVIMGVVNVVSSVIGLVMNKNFFDVICNLGF